MTISPYVPPSHPRCLCVPGIDPQAFPLLSSPLILPTSLHPLLCYLLEACGALLVVAYLRLAGYSVFLTHWPLLCTA